MTDSGNPGISKPQSRKSATRTLQDLEHEKLILECDRLKWESSWRKWLSVLAGPALLAAIFGSLVAGFFQIRVQRTQLENTISMKNAELVSQFESLTEGKLWQANLDLCYEITTTAANIRNSAEQTGDAKHKFAALLYGKSTMLENYEGSDFRNTMEKYKTGVASCKKGDDRCWDRLDCCVEAMGCLCRARLCKAHDRVQLDAGAPRATECQGIENCSRLQNNCKTAADEISQQTR